MWRLLPALPLAWAWWDNGHMLVALWTLEGLRGCLKQNNEKMQLTRSNA